MPTNKNPMRFLVAFLTIPLMAILISGCVVSRNPLSGNKRAYGYSWQQEIQMGRDADKQIVSQYGMYGDDELTEYIDSLGQALLQVSHLRRPGAEQEWVDTEFFFRVLDSPVINAFALPGGYIYVTRGLLAHLENEAQLAVVLGHEIGHVAGRHASRRAASQLGGNLLLIGAAVGGQALFGGGTAENILNVGGSATQLLFLSYGRGDERESDQIGVEYASMVGYDASEASAFFRTLKRLSDQSESKIPSFLSTHPDPGEREQTILRLADEWASQYQTDRIAREYYLSRVNNIVFGQNPRDGFVQDRRFYHPEMAFEFPVPDDYALINQPTRVVMIAEDERAAVILEIDQEHATAEAAADAFLDQEGMQLVERGLGTVNNLSARYVVADVKNSDGQLLRLRAHFIDFDGTVFQFLGLASQQSFDNYDPQFLRTMRGFKRLTDAQILNRQPDRLILTSTQAQKSFESMLPATLPSGLTASAMAILNQVELSDVLPRGRTIKLVE
ncbi:MAG: M48 family metallopeptidase [Rhodothermia bacterium]|nr:MAG: M48 family metallopeptidase [Rhodothermia bacterium]